MPVELNITPHKKEEIVATLLFAFMQMEEYISALPENKFLTAEQGKWSPGQQLQHLINSAYPVAISLFLPKISFFPFGKDDDRASRSYADIAGIYKSSLGNGAKSPFLFKPGSAGKYNPERLLQQWKTLQDHFKSALYLQWNERDLDTYRMPHPILGMLTVREMLFFTTFHTLYHLNSMKQVYG